jgi:post-segregation antitoxin (ccd killing protein)
MRATYSVYLPISLREKAKEHFINMSEVLENALRDKIQDLESSPKDDTKLC